MKKNLNNLNLRNKTLSAFRWLAIGKFTGQLINWAVTLIVIRLLTPSDYGLMSMSMVFISIFSLLNEMGLGSAIIQVENIGQHTLQKIFGIVLIINFVLFVLMFNLAPIIALFFRENKIIPIIELLSLQFILMGFNIIPQSLLARDMDFKKKSIVDLIANLSGSFITLGLAFSGQGIWALVCGSMIISVSTTVGINIVCPFFYRPVFSFKGMSKFISFGSFVMMEKVIWYFYSQADVMIIGRILGKELLGFYSIGKHLASLPSQKVSPIVNQVVFPAFSRIQGEHEKISFYFLKGVRLLSFISFPIFMGISSVAPEFVTIILGDKWRPAITTIIWISLVIPLQMVSGLIVSVLKSLGRSDISFKNILTASILMPVSFLIGCKWGILGVSLAWAFIYPVYFLTTTLRAAPYIGLKLYNIFKSMLNPLVCSASMYVVIVILRILLKDYLSSFSLFIILITAGASVYMGLMQLIDRYSFSELKELIKFR